MINAEILNRCGISYSAGVDRFMGDPAMYEAVLTAFIGEDMLERAEAAYAAKNMEQLREVIHEAKGACGNAGFDKLFSEASSLVVLLRSNSYTEGELAENYNRFVSAYTVARNGIKAALGM